jgi:hypothetical protein
MNEQDSNFEPLVKLLALKRHEVPPPGYFNNFSSQVVERIRHHESAKGEGMLGTLFAEAPWLLRFVRIFDTQPAVAGTFASALFLLLVGGIVYTDYSPANNPESLMSSQSDQTPASSPLVVSSGFLDQPGPATPDQASSTNPVYSFGSGDSSFGGQNSMFQLQPAGFTTH